VIAMIGLVIRPLLTFWYDKRLDPVFKMLLFTLFSFGVLHNMMESDFLASDGPQWVTFLLTIALLYTARRESATPRQIAEP
jgi:O-antigen ligase